MRSALFCGSSSDDAVSSRLASHFHPSLSSRPLRALLPTGRLSRLVFNFDHSLRSPLLFASMRQEPTGRPSSAATTIDSSCPSSCPWILPASVAGFLDECSPSLCRIPPLDRLLVCVLSGMVIRVLSSFPSSSDHDATFSSGSASLLRTLLFSLFLYPSSIVSGFQPVMASGSTLFLRGNVSPRVLRPYSTLPSAHSPFLSNPSLIPASGLAIDHRAFSACIRTAASNSIPTSINSSTMSQISSLYEVP